METISFLHFLETPASFFPSSGKLFFKEIIIFGQWKRSLGLIMVSTRRKKAVYKRILFPIDRNSYSTSQKSVTSSRKNDFVISLDRKATSIRISIWKKLNKTLSSSKNKIFFLKHWPPSNCNNGFQKSVNERISFPLNRKSVGTSCNKGFVWNIFPRDGKTASNGRDIWDIGTKWFPLARKLLSTSQNEGFVSKLRFH